MGSINLNHTGTGNTVTLSSDGTSLLLDGTAVGGSSGGDIALADGEKVLFGDSSDLQIYHDGGDGYINNPGMGGVKVLANQFRVFNKAMNEKFIVCNHNSAVALYYDNVEKFATTSTGHRIPFSGADDTNSIRIEGSNGASERYAFDIVANGENGRAEFKVGQGGGTPTTEFMIHPDGGICFGTDTAAANALDDYEEGTWTPAFGSADGTTPTGNFTTAGYYTKIGRQVNIIGFMKVDSGLSRGSGTLTITGLPFNSRDNSGEYSTGSFTASIFNTVRQDYLAITIYDSTKLAFLSAYDDVAWAWETTNALNTNCELRFNITYHTDS